MPLPVFPLKKAPNAEGIFTLSQEDVQHLHRSLRLESGDLFQIFLPDGARAEATLLKGENGWFGRIEKSLHGNAPHQLPLWLGVGMVRWSSLEWLVEKATELGTQRITPLYMEFGKYTPRQKISETKVLRLSKIAGEALKQCERTQAPRIDSPQTLEQWLKETSEVKVNKFLLDETISQPRLGVEQLNPNPPFIFLIGPEGGLSPAEKENATTQGFQSVSLGSKKLRTETAALYAICLLDSYLKL